MSGGSYSTYAYAGGSPANNIDPSGNFVFPVPPPVAAPIATSVAAAAVGAAVGYGIGTWIYNANATAIQDALEQQFPYSPTDAPWEQQDWVDQQNIERKANAREVHGICDAQPPPNMDPCTAAKWELATAKSCKAVRQAMTDKWYGGVTDAVHAGQNAQVDNRIKRAEKAVEHACKPGCQK